MKRPLFIVTAIAAVAVGVTLWCVQNSRSPTSVNAKPILEVDEIRSEHQPAVRAAIRELVKQEENPEEFFVHIDPPNDESTIVLELWHQDAFGPGIGSVEGNPGGKCRTMYFDREMGEITRSLLWK